MVVPTRIRVDRLRHALANIRAVEGRDLSLEIIVGDNGECPDTRVVVAAFDVIHVRATVQGASAARNAAMARATGDFIALLDDDDAWLPGYIRSYLDLLDQRPDLDGVIAQVRFADEALNILPTGEWPDNHPGEGEALVR